ncbi:MAG: SDR family oxidoreductase [Kiritimatiellaeota bacterium]|nr:SDR family oxidoreductase [Kiritimatiellota bacterium]
MNFLELTDKTIVVFGVANRRSVAHAIGRVLARAGADVVYVVRDETVRAGTARLLGDAPVLTCDVEQGRGIARLAAELEALRPGPIHGIVHSIAFANYSHGFGPFIETDRADFLQAVDISCYSLIALVRALKPRMASDGAVVTMSISTTRMAAENYGYMGPVKAALDSTVVFLAKSLSVDTRIRVNAVGAGLLKTSASAGIPGYIDSYLFAEQVVPRKEALRTEEVADVAAFLLSPRSTGINGQTVVVDAGMSINYFDRDIVRRATRPDPR